MVGIDLSLTSTGLATPAEVQRVRSKGVAKDSLALRYARLLALHDQVLAAATRPRLPNLVVIEGPSVNSRYGHAHDRSGLWWLVVGGLFEMEVPVAVMAPAARCKYATGKGSAPKDTVLSETVRRYRRFAVDGNDTADALVLCAAGMDRLGHPLVDLPQTHRAALDKVEWPADLKART